ncbi:replicative DNA helicase [Pseudomonas gingeri]|uniref:replicative DNA helicase n=1 Tax=Pseudomonas gingeri TaxID=117681 RepID=UPI0015A47ED1|nr:replicative DNA helicase [Pseudomonas gingeri]NVZ61240.1 replicative DNA helicase [Pseudomonas gingeri]NVZ77137.1 replicative DNA helicase [Pseudomonas gingeri]
MRDPYSLEAEHAVLGAMLIKPELIDILSADLKTSDFFFADNRAVFEAIQTLKARGTPVDFLTVAEQVGDLHGDSSSLAYCAELHRNTPSAANARAYANTVLERSTVRALMTAAQAIHEIAQGDSGTEDKITQSQAEINAIGSSSAGSETITAGEAIRRHVEELERREALGGAMDGLSTGIPSLDAKIMGLKGGQLIIIAGRPKMGKTTLAMNIVDHNAVRDGKRVLVFSQEMSHGELMDKSLASLGNIPLKALKDGTALKTHSTQMVETSNLIHGAAIELYDRSGVTINRIRSAARRQKMNFGLDLVVVDHLGLVDVDDARANAVQRISEITRQLKLLAKELDVPVIALSQLNRQLEQRPNKRPTPSDLRDSGSIEQDADMIVFVYRDEVYEPNTQFRGIAEIIIGAARGIQPCTVRVSYQGGYSRFVELVAKADSAPPDLFDDGADYSPKPESAVAKVTSMAERYKKQPSQYGAHRS